MSRMKVINSFWPAGDGSTLDLDFTQMSTLADLTSRGLTFSRSTSGTFINASGLVATATAGNPRFDYDPSTTPPQHRGLLIEGSANNIATYSNDFSNAVWTLDTSGGTIPAVSTVSQTGPDGASTVTRITFNKTGGTFSRIRQTASGTASQPYTMSVWMKANTASGGASTQNVGLRIGADSAGFNCVVTTTWKRFQYTYNLSGTDAAAQIMLWDNIIGNDETADVLIYGCQIEAGNGASSYIPTGASTGNRASESLYLDGAAFSAFWPSGQSELSVYFAGDITRPPANTQFLWVSRTGSGGVGTSRTRSFITTANSIRANTTVSDLNSTLSAAINTRIRTAVGVRSGSCALATNNGTTSTIVVNTDTGLSTDATQLVFNPNADVFQHVSSLKFWPTRLPDAQLQALIT